MDRADGRARRRIPRWLLRSVAVVLALVLALLCYQVIKTALALRAAQSEAVTLQAALADRDLVAAETGADRLAQHAAVAHSSSDGILWRAATWLPFVGDDADAVRSVARALDEVAHAAPQALDLIRMAEKEDLRTADGRIRLDLVERLGPGAQRLASATGRATASVAPIDTASLLPPAAGPVRDFLGRLDRLDSAAVGLASATRVLPKVLGGEGTSRYLLVVQNNAEVRATGGLPGSFAELVARDGRLRIGFQGSSGDVMGDGSPVAAFAPGEDEVFGPLLVTDFRDTTFTPQFPRAAELMADFVERARPGTELDGIVVLDPVTLARILDVTGSVDVGGTQLRGDDAVQTLLFDAYQDIDGDRAQDRFFQAAARATLDAVLGSDAELPSLVGPLQGAVEQRRLLLWSRDSDVRDAIEGLSVSGALPTGTGRPEVGIFINSGTASKMQYFLRSSYAVESLGCRDDGRQLVEVRATFANTLDRPIEELSDYVTGLGDAIPGEQRLRVRVFAPEAGELVGLDVDGARVPVGQAQVYDRQVTQFSVSALPGEQVRVVARLLGPPDQTTAPRLRWTPGVTWAPTEQVALPRC